MGNEVLLHAAGGGGVVVVSCPDIIIIKPRGGEGVKEEWVGCGIRFDAGHLIDFKINHVI